MPFNFFQRKKNRPDSGRGSKEVISEKSPAILGHKKSNVSPDFKKEISESSKKTNSAPQGMILHISEKSSDLLALNSYVFKIFGKTNKITAKKTIEKHYGVKVESVRVLNTNSKKRIRGNTVGHKPGYKKAIVKLKEGFKIDL